MIEKIKEFYKKRGFIFTGVVKYKMNKIDIFLTPDPYIATVTLIADFEKEEDFQDFVLSELEKRNLEFIKHFTNTQYSDPV